MGERDKWGESEGRKINWGGVREGLEGEEEGR